MRTPIPHTKTSGSIDIDIDLVYRVRLTGNWDKRNSNFSLLGSLSLSLP